jgi:hypothetical protein
MQRGASHNHTSAVHMQMPFAAAGNNEQRGFCITPTFDCRVFCLGIKNANTTHAKKKKKKLPKIKLPNKHRQKTSFSAHFRPPPTPKSPQKLKNQLKNTPKSLKNTLKHR